MKQKLLLFALTVLPLVVHAQLKVKIDGIYYNLSGVSASVTRDGNSSTGYTFYREESYRIPASVTYQGMDYTVTSMDVQAFYGSSASSIILPNTIKNIGEMAFNNCTKLTSIDLGEVESIGGYAFSQCSSLA